MIGTIVVDWDETITSHDTMATLASCSNDPDSWSSYVKLYLDDMQKHEIAYGPRTTLQEHLDYLASLTEVENRSVQRIQDAHLFEGVTLSAIEDAASSIDICQGFRHCVDALDTAWEILSVNWSTQLIEAALRPLSITVTANRLILEDGYCTGLVDKNEAHGIRTGKDKLNIFFTRQAEVHARKQYAVYIGDSNTDLPCLLAADLGIIFGSNESLSDTCRRYAIKIDDLHKARLQSGVLYRTHSWHDIETLLKTLTPGSVP